MLNIEISTIFSEKSAGLIYLLVIVYRSYLWLVCVKTQSPPKVFEILGEVDL